MLYLTNRFHVAVRLFSNRSQMTSKCRKNKEVAHEPPASVSLLFLPHFDVLCDLLLNRPTSLSRIGALELDYPMIQFLVIVCSFQPPHYQL